MSGPSSVPLLRFDSLLVKRAGRVVLQLPELTVRSGQIICLLGDNGAGKSTLLLSGAGLIDLAQGKIWLGQEIFHQGRAPAAKALRRRIGLVMQEPFLLGHRVRQAIGYGLRLRQLSRPERHRQVDEVMERLSICSLSKRSVQELSGGERRQVALAAMLVLKPDLLLLDEITAGLDQQACQRVEQIISEEAQRGAGVLLATHLRKQAARLATQQIELRDGNLI